MTLKQHTTTKREIYDNLKKLLDSADYLSHWIFNLVIFRLILFNSCLNIIKNTFTLYYKFFTILYHLKFELLNCKLVESELPNCKLLVRSGT